MSFENFSSNDFSFLGFFIFPDGNMETYGVSLDYFEKNQSLELSSHILSAFQKLEEIGYESTQFESNHIYLLAKELVKENIITYVNLDGTSKNLEGMLHVGYSLTLKQKETLWKLRPFFSNIDNFLVDFDGCPLEQADFYRRLENGTEKEKKLYFKF